MAQSLAATSVLHAGSADAASLAMTLKGLEALVQGPEPIKSFVQVPPMTFLFAFNHKITNILWYSLI